MHNKVLGMQIKSWQIAVVGTIPIIIFLLIVAIAMMRGGSDPEYSLIFGFIGLFGLVIVSIPALCLKSSEDNIRKFGAIISIFFGLFVLIGIFGMAKGNFMIRWGDFILEAVTLAPGFLLLLAGIYYFWKKQ